MKKIFTTLFLMIMLINANAVVTLSFSSLDENEEEVITYITKDTTIVVSEYTEDLLTGKTLMEVTGYVSTPSELIHVDIQRSTTGIKDQFCMGTCFEGNAETFEQHDISVLPDNPTSWFAHFYPTEPGTTTITYFFDNGCNCPEGRKSITVKYCYMTSDIQSVSMSQTNSKIYNLLGQEMPTKDFNDLPAGIYVINGKKFIKQ